MLVEFDTTAPIDGHLMQNPDSGQYRIVLFKSQPLDGGAQAGFTFNTKEHPTPKEAMKDAMAVSKSDCVVMTERTMPDNTIQSTLHFLPMETK